MPAEPLDIVHRLLRQSWSALMIFWLLRSGLREHAQVSDN